MSQDTDVVHIAKVRIECCDAAEPANIVMNAEGHLHFRCIYCGFELDAGIPPKEWTPEDAQPPSWMDT